MGPKRGKDHRAVIGINPIPSNLMYFQYPSISCMLQIICDICCMMYTGYNGPLGQNMDRIVNRTLLRGESLPMLVRRQPQFGVGLRVEEKISKRIFTIAKVEPLLGGVRVKVYGAVGDGRTMLINERLCWGGRWTIL